MKNYNLLKIVSLLLILGLSSCGTSRYIYNPPRPNVPLLKEKGESKLSAAAATSGLSFQGAYAFSEHIAATASMSFDNLGDIDKNRKSFNHNSSTIEYGQNLIDIGLGYFVPLNEKRTVTFNLFGGIGLGKYTLNEKEDSINNHYERNYESKLFEYYIQPSLNIMPSDAFRIGFYFKPTFIKYGEVKTDYGEAELEYFGFDKIHNQTINYLELGYDALVKIPGLNWLYLEHTFSLLPSTNRKLSETRLYPQSSSISIGLTVDLSKLSK